MNQNCSKQYYLIQGNKLSEWVERLITDGHELIAPVEHEIEPDCFQFSTLAKAKDLRLDYDTTMIPPIQKVFAPKEGVAIIKWVKKGKSGKFETTPGDTGRPLVLFGIHPYDIHGLNIHVEAMAGGLHPDPFVYQQREKLTVVGLDIISPPPDSFCESIGTHTIDHGYDIVLTSLHDGNYFAEVATNKGYDLVKKELFPSADLSHLLQRDLIREVSSREYPKAMSLPLVDLPAFLESKINHPYFEKVGGECIACVKCIVVCPTCICGNTKEVPALDGESGARVRYADGCQNPPFDIVAGGSQVRDEQSNRMRIRLLHKLAYPTDDYEITCIGCGRCIKACPADIADPVDSIKHLMEV